MYLIGLNFFTSIWDLNSNICWWLDPIYFATPQFGIRSPNVVPKLENHRIPENHNVGIQKMRFTLQKNYYCILHIKTSASQNLQVLARSHRLQRIFWTCWPIFQHLLKKCGFQHFFPINFFNPLPAMCWTSKLVCYDFEMRRIHQ